MESVIRLIDSPLEMYNEQFWQFMVSVIRLVDSPLDIWNISKGESTSFITDSINCQNCEGIRAYVACNKNTFVHNLNAIDWNEVLPNSNAQLAFSTFHSLIKKEYDTNFPLIKVKRQYNNKKPWLTNCLRKSIRQKKIYIKAKARPTASWEITLPRIGCQV